MSNNFINNLRLQLEPEIENLGYELVDLEFVFEEGDYRLRFYIYKDGGVDLDDTEIVSRYLDQRLDELDPIDKRYFLEVSSPDLSRPLKTDGDLRRNLGNEVNIHLYKKLDGRKEFEGILNSYDSEFIEILVNEKNIKILRKDISLIKLVIRF